MGKKGVRPGLTPFFYPGQSPAAPIVCPPLWGRRAWIKIKNGRKKIGCSEINVVLLIKKANRLRRKEQENEEQALPYGSRGDPG
jgi:hypothetical protein